MKPPPRNRTEMTGLAHPVGAVRHPNAFSFFDLRKCVAIAPQIRNGRIAATALEQCVILTLFPFSIYAKCVAIAPQISADKNVMKQT